MLSEQDIIKMGWLKHTPMKPNKPDPKKPSDEKKLWQLVESPNYIVEPKIDGAHIMIIGGRIVSAHGKDRTDNFPQIINIFKSMDYADFNFNSIVIDGEMYYPGKTSKEINSVLNASPEHSIQVQKSWGIPKIVIWDILHMTSFGFLIKYPWIKRRKILEQFFEKYEELLFSLGLEDNSLHIQSVITQNKTQWIKEYMNQGHEGAVIKDINSVYELSKRPMWKWLKVKKHDEVDLFITGYKEPTKLYKGKDIENHPYWLEGEPVTKYYYHNWIGALELSAYKNGKVEKITTVSGIDENLRKKITENKENYLNRVVKIEFMEKTDDGNPRHPMFKSFHETKRPEECIWE